MSYLDDAVTEIQSNDCASFLHVQPTDVVDISGEWDAREYGERYYGRQHRYNGAYHTVAEEVDDGYHVMVMEETL